MDARDSAAEFTPAPAEETASHRLSQDREVWDYPARLGDPTRLVAEPFTP